MGGKIRDTDDEYVGAEGRYDEQIDVFSAHEPQPCHRGDGPRLGHNLQARFEERMPAAGRQNLRPRHGYQPADGEGHPGRPE